MTMDEFFKKAISFIDKTETNEWLDNHIWSNLDDKEWNPNDKSFEECRAIIVSNLGYWAGYYSEKEAKKVFNLFDSVHPIFGTSTYHSELTPEEVLTMGENLGKNSRNQE